MTATTTHAHELLRGDGFMFCNQCHQGMLCGLPQNRKCLRVKPKVSSADLETRALGMLTDDQAMASFIRWRTALHGAKAVQSIRTAADVSEYVNAIFEQVPHD